jgi:hypothetical protein
MLGSSHKFTGPQTGEFSMSARASSAIPQSRLEALRSKHEVLTGRIEEAHRQPSSTDFYLRQLKKQRLAVKEQIESLREGSASA